MKASDRIPVNPYRVGGSFLDYCARQGWMLKEREGWRAAWFVTAAGVTALKGFGIQIQAPAKPARLARDRPALAR
jgi:hypothetical protein